MVCETRIAFRLATGIRAVIRAVGGTKSQITRLVLAEALTLGLLGSVVGVLLGLHSAGSANVIAAKLILRASSVNHRNIRPLRMKISPNFATGSTLRQRVRPRGLLLIVSYSSPVTNRS